MFRMGFVNLYTDDVAAGLAFRTPAEGTPEQFELRIERFAVALNTLEAAKRVHGIDAAPGSPVMSIVSWSDDTDDVFPRVAAAGTPALQEPHDTGNSNRNALLHDPDGSLVEIGSEIR